MTVAVGDVAPETRRGENELGCDDRDESVADRELDPGEKMRRRGRQLQPNGGRERPHAVHACDLGQDARDTIQPVQGRDDHRDDGRGDPDQQDRNERQAEDRDQHRIEDEDRYRIIGREERIECLPQSREGVNQTRVRSRR